MSARGIEIEEHDGIIVLRLNRPPANAFCLELAREIESVLGSRAVREARSLVLTGAGRFFSGGLDLELVPGYSLEQQREFLGLLNRMIGNLYAWPVPIVAAVNGHAVAGAYILVLAADYRIGPTSEARFGLTEARVGIPFPAVPMIVLHAECAPPDVRYTTLYAQTFGPEEARRRGLFDELQRPEAVLPRALEVARDLASMPPDAYRRVKHQVRAAAIARIEEVVAQGSDPMLAGWLSPEAREASRTLLDAPRPGRG